MGFRALVVIVACSAAAQLAGQTPRSEGSAASQSAVASPPFDAPALARAGAEQPRLRSLLVSVRGEMVFERYFHGARATSLANIKSASKSLISALVGIAIDRKLLTGVEQPIDAFFPGVLTGEANAGKRQITVEHLLTMQSGLASTSNRNYGAWVTSGNWVRFALMRPLESLPGTRMIYSTGNSHLLSAVITKVSGSSTWQFAQAALAKPLGFSLARWPQDPQGVYFGGNDMLLTPRQMLAFGELYLHRGRVGDRQVLPASWVDASFVPRTRSRISDQMYGYGWWIRDVAGTRVFFAWGYGGQFIFVVPTLDLVVATTSTSTTDDDRRAHRRTVDDLIERLIIEPMAAVRATQ
jgi:CubicO group peptidase (beta-lactamase class C family)